MELESFPLISVLTPVFNGGEFIERNIISVLKQDYKYVEHVIQDNLSDDGTKDILKKYSEYINCVSEPDSGQADGLNKSLQRSCGDIIIVLNADDELMPGACSWAARNFELFPDQAVIYGDKYNVDEKGTVKYTYFGPDPYDFLKIFCMQDIIPAQSAFISRKHFRASGFFFDSTLATCPDFEVWIRIGLIHEMKHVPGVLSRYRMHSGSESQNAAIILKMAESKLNVIRKFSDEVGKKYGFNVLKRARSGLFFWAATNFLRLGEIKLFIKFVFLSFAENPFMFFQGTGGGLKKILKRIAS